MCSEKKIDQLFLIEDRVQTTARAVGSGARIVPGNHPNGRSSARRVDRTL
jgi:hypothetical protein